MPITSQTRNRTQVSVVRFSMSQRHSTAEMIGSTGDHGTRNPRGRSGRVRRSTTMPRLTSTNADSVPMLIISSSSPTSVNAGDEGDDGAADDLDAGRGLGVLGEVFDSQRGSSPSRLSAKTMRERPSSSTMITVVRPTSAPTRDHRPTPSPAPTSRNAVASDGVSSSASSVYDTMPVITIDTST